MLTPPEKCPPSATEHPFDKLKGFHALARLAAMPGMDEELWFRGMWLAVLARALGPGRE